MENGETASLVWSEENLSEDENEKSENSKVEQSTVETNKGALFNIFNYPSTNFKRDPTIDNIIETRKSNLIENAYTRLAQTTSQRVRSSQQVRPPSAKLRTANNEINRANLQQHDSKSKIDFPSQQFDEGKWDDGLNSDFDKASIASIDKSSLQVYEETCKRLKICPCSTVIRSLNLTHIYLGNYGLGPRGCAALAVALVRNTSVVSLDLSGNDIGSAGMSHIYQIMTENAYVEDYNLANNKLGAKGAAKLGAAASYCLQLRSLDISGNQLVAKDVQDLLSKFEDHQNLKYLNISHNSLDDQGAVFLGKWLADNNVLLQLNASWCSIRLKGATTLIKSIGDNNKLQTLNLSFNSLTNHIADTLADSISHNQALIELNLEGNKISCRYEKEIEDHKNVLINGKEAFVFHILKAAMTNQSLKKFRLGRNYLDRHYLVYILENLGPMENISLEELDLTGLSLNDKDVAAIGKAFINHPKLVFHLGSVRYTVEHFANNLLNAIKIHCNERQMSLSDFFLTIDESHRGSMNFVNHEQFVQALKQNRIPYPTTQIQEILQFLSDETENETIFLSSLESGRRSID